jgi:hypothetical protein
MNKKQLQTIDKKTHCYQLPDGTIVRAISESHVEEYQKEGKTVYTGAASKRVDGTRVETQNYYVAITDFVKRTSARASLQSKLASITASHDTKTMSAAELLALLQA